jgi:anti-sigma factor (TIGR02949 family)
VPVPDYKNVYGSMHRTGTCKPPINRTKTMSNDIEEIECEQAIKQLLVYLDNELNNHDHKVLEKHLHTCRSCYSRMEFEKKLKSTVSDAKEEAKASDNLRSRIKNISDLF